jgi:hypothetical protein
MKDISLAVHHAVLLWIGKPQCNKETTMKALMSTLLFLAMPMFGQQQKAPAIWPQEPASFLGVKFHAPLRASAPECPYHLFHGAKIYDFRGSAVCFESSYFSSFLYNVSGFTDVDVWQIEGDVASVSATFPNQNVDFIIRGLKEKFGDPMVTKEDQVRSKAGVSYERMTMRWAGIDVVLELQTVGARVDEGIVTASTLQYLKQQASSNRQEIENYRDKF